jgi:hypothetical protein
VRNRPGLLLREHWFAVLCAATLVYLVVAEVSRGPHSSRQWDWLMHSGAVVFLLALGAALRVAPAVPGTVQRIRIIDRGGNAGGYAGKVLAVLSHKQRSFGLAGMPVGAAAMAGVWIAARHRVPWDEPLFWLELIAAGGAGYLVGGFIAFGRLGVVIERLQLKPQVIPGHPDGAAGLRPVGALYLRQAMIVAIIGVFAGVWWVLMPMVGYRSWRTPYLAIVLVCLVLEAVSMYLPLAAFHRSMDAQRTQLLVQADPAAREAALLESNLAAQPLSATAAADARAARDRINEQWLMIDTMPTWPVDARIRRRFTWNNIAMLIPLLLQIMNAPQLLQQLSRTLSGIS